MKDEGFDSFGVAMSIIILAKVFLLIIGALVFMLVGRLGIFGEVFNHHETIISSNERGKQEEY